MTKYTEDDPDYFPHCDSYVLHEPTKCSTCDTFPKRQAQRVTDGIAFTGQAPYPGGPEKPCPSTQRRTLDTINKWPGNRPQTEKEKQEREDFMKKVGELLDKLKP